MPESHDKLLKAVEQIPAFPKSVQQVLTLAQDINCSPRDLVDVIKHDPIFTMKIIKLVNSPFIGLRQKITSIQQASVYLGLNTLKNMALNLATIGSLPRKNKAGLDMNGFWLHSLSVAAVAKKLAEKLDFSRSSQEDLFSAGLLHDVGKVVFALYMPDEFKAVLAEVAETEESFHLVEDRVIGADHATMGALVADKWALPEALTTIIACHHNTEPVEKDVRLESPPDFSLDDAVACITTANLVCKHLAIGAAGSVTVEALPPYARERFGRELGYVAESIPELEKDLEKARIFIEV